MKTKKYSQILKTIYGISPDAALRMLAENRSSMPKKERIALLISIGAKFWTDDRSEEAKGSLEYLSKQKIPIIDKAECYEYLGYVYLEDEDYEKAIRVFKKCLSLTKNRYLCGAAYHGLSRCYYMIPDRKKSIYYAYQGLRYRSLRKKAEVYDYYDYLETIIDNLLLMEKKNKADDIVTKYFKRKNVPKGILSHVYHSFGNYFYRKQNWVEALKNYEKALANFNSSYLSPKGIILKNMGSCYLRLKEYRKAKETYLQSLKYLSDKEDMNGKIFVKGKLKIVNRKLRSE